MNGFKKEKLNDWERQSLREKYSLKGMLFGMGVILIVLLVGSFVIPFIPPKYSGSWSPPTSQQEYNDWLITSFIWMPILILLTFLALALRSTIDLRLDYKKTGDFQVTSILHFGSMKILVLDNWRLFKIGKRGDYFEKVKKGQRIQIKRTGTHRLINYHIYNKKASA